MTYQIHQRDAELRGVEKGRAEGENNILRLMQQLFAAGRAEDVEKAARDKNYCNELLAEFGLAQ